MTATVLAKPAFADPKLPPTPEQVTEMIGVLAATAMAKVDAWLAETHPDATSLWKFSPQSGWHEIRMLKKRRLFYFVPKRRDCRLSLILGDKAIMSLGATELATQVITLLKTAQRYPEGTAFMFDRQTLKPPLVIALLEAKIAH